MMFDRRERSTRRGLPRRTTEAILYETEEAQKREIERLVASRIIERKAVAGAKWLCFLVTLALVALIVWKVMA